jgi:hypothetical protein
VNTQQEIIYTDYSSPRFIKSDIVRRSKEQVGEQKRLGRTDQTYKAIREIDTEIFKGLLPELIKNIENVHPHK